MGQSMVREAKLPYELNVKHWIATWGAFLNSGIGMIIVSVDGDDLPIGAIGAHPHTDPNDGSKCNSEAFWFVLPEHRNGRVGIDLLKALEGWSVLHSCKRISMVHFVALNPRLAKIYERMGYVATEIHYIKKL